MPKVFSMQPESAKVAPVTVEDPFVNVYDDNSVEQRKFNTFDEARSYIPERWKEGTKTMRVSELPKK